MTGSLRALLGGAIDYAGMFPPAGLPLVRALDEYRRHRGGAGAWILGRFVVPAGKLADLADSYHFERDGRLTVIVSPGDTGESFLRNLDAALTSVARFPIAGAVDTLEFRWPAESLREADRARLGNLVQTAAGHIAASRCGKITMFFELPRREMLSTDTKQHDAVRAAVAALADYNQTATALNCRAGFKLRCVETETAGTPTSAEVAPVVCECRDRGVFWKATAGLHHPVRHIDPARHIPMHGFLNLLVAAVLADVHRLDEPQIEVILETTEARQFAFTDNVLTWGDFSVAPTQIIAARERSLRSFGSCSVDEPLSDLRSLGWL